MNNVNRNVWTLIAMSLLCLTLAALALSKDAKEADSDVAALAPWTEARNSMHMLGALGQRLLRSMQQNLPEDIRHSVGLLLLKTGAADTAEKRDFWARYFGAVAKSGGVETEKARYLSEFIGFFYAKDGSLRTQDLLHALRGHARLLRGRVKDSELLQRVIQDIRAMHAAETAQEEAQGIAVFRNWLLPCVAASGETAPLLQIRKQGEALQYECLEGEVAGADLRLLKEVLQDRKDLPDVFTLEIVPGRPESFFDHQKPDTLSIPKLAFCVGLGMQEKAQQLLPAWEKAAQREGWILSAGNKELQEGIHALRRQVLEQCLDHELGHLQRKPETELLQAGQEVRRAWTPLQKAFWLWLKQTCASEGIAL